MKSILKNIFLLFIFFVSANFSFAQTKEYNIWYFGNKAGVDFNSGKPAALTNSAMRAYEGGGTICDTSGNLLMYNDGITLWNKNHQPMLNGGGLLSSNTNLCSTTQTGLIVRLPESKNIYYVFTILEEGGEQGLRYSIVDMSRDGGLGEVTNKNIPLLPFMTEKMTAVYHENKQDIWIVTHGWNSDIFYSYLITRNGLNDTPVQSKSGTVHTGVSDNAIGQMKISSNGKKLALTISDEAIVEVFDFNTSSGQVSNPRTIELKKQNGFSEVTQTYGVEFSPNSSKLYTSVLDPNCIIQFDLRQANLSNPQFISFSTAQSLQIAPDGKIYCALKDLSQLGVINSPDSAGMKCQYCMDCLSLLGRNGDFGLPGNIAGFAAQPKLNCQNVAIKIPRLSAAPGTKNISVPIQLGIEKKFLPRTIENISFDLQFSGENFIPDLTATSNAVIGYNAASNEYTAHFAKENFSFSEDGGVIAELKGDIILGRDDSTLFTFSNATVEDCATVQTEDGVLDLSACFLKGRRIQPYTPLSFELAPSPADESFVIRPEGISIEAQLSIISSFGKEIFSLKIPKGQKEISVNSKEFASGAYNVSLREGKNNVQKQLMILH